MWERGGRGEQMLETGWWGAWLETDENHGRHRRQQPRRGRGRRPESPAVRGPAPKQPSGSHSVRVHPNPSAASRPRRRHHCRFRPLLRAFPSLHHFPSVAPALVGSPFPARAPSPTADLLGLEFAAINSSLGLALILHQGHLSGVVVRGHCHGRGRRGGRRASHGGRPCCARAQGSCRCCSSASRDQLGQVRCASEKLKVFGLGFSVLGGGSDYDPHQHSFTQAPGLLVFISLENRGLI